MISAVILAWNSANYIEECLRSLAADAHHTGIELEIFVVDGGSSDGTETILFRLSKEIRELRVIRLGRNIGTTISRNIAIREARGEYLLILDSDTKIMPGALKELQKTLESAQRTGIAAPRLIYPNGAIQTSFKRFPTAIIKICKFMPISWIQRLGEKLELYPSEVYKRNFGEVIHVDHCISACWLVRREAIHDIGLFDEQIFYAPEDVDYCLRMWLCGWEVLYVPKAEVVHHAQRLSRKNLVMAFVHAKGLLYYFRKHRYYFSQRSLYYRIKQTAKKHKIEPPFRLEL